MGAWLTFAWFLNIVSTPAYFAYLGQGKLRWITIAHIIMGAVNIIAGLVLGHFFGWQGILAAFVGSLVLGSFIPVWAYHHEHRIKNIKFITVYDMVSAGVGFTSAVIALASYWTVLDASLMDKWERVTMFTGIVLLLSAVAIWLHPLRWKLINRISISTIRKNN
jgi:O-antigen/teichoic acid export membrane protein